MKRLSWVLSLSGCLFLLAVGAITVLSRQFVYGEAHATRPIGLFLLCYGLCWVTYGLGIVWRNRDNRKQTLYWILGVALVARLLLWPANVILEADFYRYAFEGQMILKGLSPYHHAPAVIDLENLSLESERTQALRLKERVTYSHVSTIYPPLAQAFFALHARLFGWNEMGFRFLFLLIDALALFCVFKILKILNRPSQDVIWYAWNPLVLKEGLNGMHVDMLCMLCLFMMCLYLLRRQSFRTWSTVFAAGLVKLTPFILWPVLWVHMIKNDLKVKFPTLFFGFLGFLGIGFLYFLGGHPFKGLLAFSQQWETNGSLYPLLKGIFIRMGMSSWEAGLTLKVSTLLGLGGLFLKMRPHMKSVTGCLRVCGWLLYVLFLCSPVGNPWYLLWLIPFLIIDPQWIWVWTMGWVSLYYFEFSLYYHDQSHLLGFLKWMEYTPVYVALAWFLGKRVFANSSMKIPAKQNS